MVKVQNGWERHSIEELEELPSQHRSAIVSPGFSDRKRRASGFSESSVTYMASPIGQASPQGISRSLNATPSSASTYLQPVFRTVNLTFGLCYSFLAPPAYSLRIAATDREPSRDPIFRRTRIGTTGRHRSRAESTIQLDSHSPNADQCAGRD